MERLRIQVTAEDIAAAERNTSSRCAVAVAIRRQIPGARRIEVDIQAIRFTLDGERLAWQTPNRALRYIVEYDFGGEIEPFTFEARERLELRSKARTEAGRQIDQARSRQRRAAAKVERLEQRTRSGPAPRAAAEQLPPATADLEAATADLEAAKAAHAGAPKERVTQKGPRLPQKRRTREFGVRSLRLERSSDA